MRTVVQRETEWDDEQRELMQALDVYESSVNEFGIPLDEAMSSDADPDNPKGTHFYDVKVLRDFSVYAVEMEQKKPEWSGENYLRSRRFTPVRVER